MKKFFMILAVLIFIYEIAIFSQGNTTSTNLTFKNYSIDYPSNLRLSKKTDTGNFMLMLTPQEDISMVVIDLSQYQYDIPLKDYAASALGQLKDEHFTTVLENKPLTINNLTCWRFVCAFDDGHGEIQAKCLYNIWIKNKWAYVLILNSLPTSFEMNKTIGQNIATSFKFTH